MKEESITFDSKKTFYNPEMRFCRSFFSLAIGALEKKLKLLDAFCASGVRGIRYVKENKNVKEITFLDVSKNAIIRTKKNMRLNKLKKTKTACERIENFCKVFHNFDLVEIDPFGTPVPYLNDAIRAQTNMKEWHLSVTATDVAVLCGPQANACLKNYHAKSLNNEFTHEVGTRILIKRVVETAAEYNFGVVPLISLSDRHYIKLLLKMVKSADSAEESVKQFGYVSYCNSCGWRSYGKRMKNKCENCKGETDYGGQLWLGELHDKKLLQTMLVLNRKRNYADVKEIDKKLQLLIREFGMQPFYYDLHVFCKHLKIKSIPKLTLLIDKLNKMKLKTVRTHFNELGIKTAASLKELKKFVH